MPKLVKKISRDFTIVNNRILRDKNIGSTERGIYITMLSLPDGWDFSIRGLACILPDGVTKISNALKKLEQFRYLRRERIYVDGKIADWDYIISDEPMEYNVPDDSKNPTETPPNLDIHNLDTANLDADNLDVGNLDTENLNQANQDFEKPYGNKINNNQESNNQESNNQKSKNQESKKKESINQSISPTTDGLTDGYSQNFNDYTGLIREKIDYYGYVELSKTMSLTMISVEELDELIGAIVRILCSRKEKIVICGQEYPIEIVKSTFMKINITCLERAIENIMKTENIKNIEGYFISTLFNEINNNHFRTNNEERWADYAFKHNFGY